MQQVHWLDRFSIGVEVIDQAHRRLFSIVEKIMELYAEKHENKFACLEGIKYFKAYAFRHFAEEEAYMREIGYPGYLSHKKLHDRMRWETLPALERLLYATDFSTKAVQRFIGVCVGWLTGHIIIADREITGGMLDELASIHPDNELSVINGVIIRPLEEIFGCNVQFAGAFSTKASITDAQYYELTYSNQEGNRLRVILIIGEQLLLRGAGLMFGTTFYREDDIVCFAIQEIAQSLIQRAAASFGQDLDAYRLEQDRFLEREEYAQLFKSRAPQYSLLFQVNQERFALCLDQIPGGASLEP